MPTKTFGRRGALAPAPRPVFQPAAVPTAPAVVLDRAQLTPDEDSLFCGNKLLTDIPFVTIGLVACLTLIFALERNLAIDISKDGSLNVRSLIAFGAVSHDMVVGRGEWWRIGLAPLLHGSTSHLIGNSIALLIVGLRLEALVSRGWFLLIFVASALAGAAGSLLGNAPDIPSVGASGAITGLIAALFVASFNPEVDAQRQISMIKTSLFFGVPALAPLAFGASGGVDYFAHAGGALAGAALMVAPWLVFMSSDDLPRGAGMTVLAGLVGSLICAGFAATHYATSMADAAQYIRASDLPANARDAARRSADLVARYPKDPRAHLLRAVDLVGQKRLDSAETALRTAISLAASDIAGGPVRIQAQAMLVALLFERGRLNEARAVATELCRANGQEELRRKLTQAKLCG